MLKNKIKKINWEQTGSRGCWNLEAEGVQWPLGADSTLFPWVRKCPYWYRVWVKNQEHWLFVNTPLWMKYLDSGVNFCRLVVWAISLSGERCNKYRAFLIWRDHLWGQCHRWLIASVGGSGDWGKMCWLIASKHCCLTFKMILFPWWIELRT